MADDIDMLSFAYASPIFLPDDVKLWFTLVNPFHPKFWP